MPEPSTIKCRFALLFPDDTFQCLFGISDPDLCLDSVECEFLKYQPFDPNVELHLSEIYPAISGEGTSAGTVCTIVRKTGCNLRCSFCDSKYTYEGGDLVTVGDVLSAVLKFGIKTVLFTGGEPLLDKTIANNLLRAFMENDIETWVETNGSIDISFYKLLAHMVMDIKCPSSGMHDRMDWNNIRAIGPNDDVKFVVVDQTDYDYATKVIEEHDLFGHTPNIYISPAWPADGDMSFLQDLSNWMIRDRSRAKLSIQQHKVIYGPILRGV